MLSGVVGWSRHSTRRTRRAGGARAAARCTTRSCRLERVCPRTHSKQQWLVDSFLLFCSYSVGPYQAKSKTADVYVVLGSSLRVTPAADLPQLALDNGCACVPRLSAC
jgi:NAD-dependent SIR2 family protein deacetylase